MKQRRVELTTSALEDLDTIYDFISAAASRNVAINFVGRIETFCRSLEHASERGTRHSHIRDGLRSVGFDRRVTIVFYVSDQSVMIVRIFYAGADWQTELEDL